MITRLFYTCSIGIILLVTPDMKAQLPDILKQKVNFDKITGKVSEFLSQAIKQKNVNLSYAPGIVNTEAEITLPSKELTLKQFLNFICKSNSMKVQVLGRQIILKKKEREMSRIISKTLETEAKTSVQRDSMIIPSVLAPMPAVNVSSSGTKIPGRIVIDKLQHQQPIKIPAISQVDKQHRKTGIGFNLHDKWDIWANMTTGFSYITFSGSARRYQSAPSISWNTNILMNIRLWKNILCETGVGFISKSASVMEENQYGPYPYDYYRDSVSNKKIKIKINCLILPVVLQFACKISKGYLGVGLGGYLTAGISGTNVTEMNNEKYSTSIKWKAYTASVLIPQSANIYIRLRRFDYGGIVKLNYTINRWNIGACSHIGFTSFSWYNRSNLNYIGLSTSYLLFNK